MHEQQFTRDAAGFHGTLFRAERPFSADKALIVLGGSDGDRKLTEVMARRFGEAGITALALFYINAPGLPRNTIEAPVESVEQAVRWLQKNGFPKTAVWGISSGGELALLSASLIPEIGCAVAVSAPTAVSQADNGKRAFPTSCWSWRGKPLPYLPVNFSAWRALPGSLRRRELYTADQYEQALANAPEDAWIAVERIQGPVLTLAAKQDTICPSAFFGEAAGKRLDNAGFSYPHRHLVYEYASHFLIPGEFGEKKTFRMERKYPEECRSNCEASFREAVSWIKEW